MASTIKGHMSNGNTLCARSFVLPGDIRAVSDPYNRRLKLYELDALALRESAACTEILDQSHCDLYSKVTAYAYQGNDKAWSEMGFRREAVIRNFYPLQGDAHLWCNYLSNARQIDANSHEHKKGVEVARSRAVIEPLLPETSACRVIAQDNDIEQLVGLLNQTFEDYPTPLDRATIRSNIECKANHFRGVFDQKGEILAAASAEIDHKRFNAELTDCATDPSARGQGLMTYLLHTLEQDLSKDFGINALYTIARAAEIGMNCAFAKLDYHYTGTLVNNCRMPQGWESMNVWCKQGGAR